MQKKTILYNVVGALLHSGIQLLGLLSHCDRGQNSLYPLHRWPLLELALCLNP
jgi:hypothetical protein